MLKLENSKFLVTVEEACNLYNTTPQELENREKTQNLRVVILRGQKYYFFSDLNRENKVVLGLEYR